MANSQKLTSQEETGIILQRYDAAQAHQLIYTYDELRALGIKPEFLMALLEVFENPAEFNAGKFDSFPLVDIIDYLQKTHSYYISKKLPEIEQSIHALKKGFSESHPLLLLLHEFYVDYTRHLTRHIEVEEHELLPYITRLEIEGSHASKSSPSISISSFMEEHHDTEKDLEDVRNAILHYSPPEEQQTPYRILLSQLEVLEKDLAVHAIIEDSVLLPRALAIEKMVASK